MAVHSDGRYGVPEGLVCGFPVVCSEGSYEIVAGRELDEFQQDMLKRTVKELTEERDVLR